MLEGGDLMWVLTKDGEEAVNLALCERLSLDFKSELWHVIAWTPARGIYVFEAVKREQCVEWINLMAARMNDGGT
jgi:hypothetical protein